MVLGAGTGPIKTPMNNQANTKRKTTPTGDFIVHFKYIQ